jgi:hypothetical protein
MPAPPKGEACVAFIVNGQCENRCRNFSDFDENGNIKPGTKQKVYSCDGANYFNKRVNFDATSFANLKAFALKIKERCEAGIK